MNATIIDGRSIAARLSVTVSRSLAALAHSGTVPTLVTVRVGDDYASAVYERRLAVRSAELGALHRPRVLPWSSSTEQVIAVIEELNSDTTVAGVLVFRPLPAHVDETAVLCSLDPTKDIEAVHPENAGLLALGTPRYVPSTAASVFHVLDTWLDDSEQDRSSFYHDALIVVVGRSNNVGKPLVSLAYSRQAAVESVDEWASRTGQLGWHTRRADVLVVAAGVPGLIRAEHVRQGAVVIDVGINPGPAHCDPPGGVVGDVDFASVAPRASAITPVPGGIGPVTDIWLLGNVAQAARAAAGMTVGRTEGIAS